MPVTQHAGHIELSLFVCLHPTSSRTKYVTSFIKGCPHKTMIHVATGITNNAQIMINMILLVFRKHSLKSRSK